MPYTREISRVNPTAIVLVLDQSTSMGDRFPGEQAGRSKAEALATAVNRLVANLVIKATKGSEVRDYYHVGIYAYGPVVGPALAGALQGKGIVPIAEIANNPLRIETRVRKVDDGAGGLVDQTIKVPIWVDAASGCGTPMCAGLGYVRRELASWLENHPDCYPPSVVHCTDGESNDGDPSDLMRKLVEIGSTDGNVILMNLHLSSTAGIKPVLYPSSDAALTDNYSRLLFKHASPLTPAMLAVARDQQLSVDTGARALVVNADPVALIEALDVGTRPANLR